MCPSVPALPPQPLRLRNIGAGKRETDPPAARGGGGAGPVAGRAAGSAGPWGWAARAWSRAHPEGGGGRDPPESGREGRPGEAPAAGGWRGAVAAAPSPARHPQGSERPGGSGGSSGKFWERPCGQRWCQGRGLEPAGRPGSDGDVGSAWFRFYLAACSGVGNNLECAPHEGPQRENRGWVRSTAWAWLGLCEGKEKPLERGSSGRGAGGPTGEVQARNLQQEDMRI